jgi:hypothetical protein
LRQLATQLEHRLREELIREDHRRQPLNQVLLHLLQEVPLDHCAVKANTGAVHDLHELFYLSYGVLTKFKQIIILLRALLLSLREPIIDLLIHKVILALKVLVLLINEHFALSVDLFDELLLKLSADPD